MGVQLDVKLRFKGHFHLTATDSITGESREVAEFDNLITNQGLNFIGSGGPAAGANAVIFYGCVVGTGTTPPSPSDTTLQSFFAGTNTISVSSSTGYSGSPAWTATSSVTYQFAAGVAAGNLTEIGVVAPGASQFTSTVPTNASPIFSRALIQVGGSPGTITILPTEVLNVTYTITTSLIQTPLTGTFTLNTNGTLTTVSYSLLTSSAGGGNWTLQSGQLKFAPTVFGSLDGAYPSGSTLGLPSGNPTGTLATFSGTISTAAYSANTFFISVTASVTVGSGNTTSNSIGAMTINRGTTNSFPLQIAFSPAIGKTNLQTFSIIINWSWSN